MTKHKLHTKIYVVLFTLIIAICSCCIISSCSPKDETNINIGSLYGPTTVSLLQMRDNDAYNFTTVSQTDAIVSDINSSKLDIALLPANLASNLYNKTNGKIKVIDINTLAVLKILSQKQDINNFKGITIYSTGKGTIVQAMIDVFLQANSLNESDVNLQFKSEASEVISFLNKDANAVGFVNEPQASISLEKFTNLHLIGDINDYWKQLYGQDSQALTAVTVARSDFIEEHPAAIKQFLTNHKNSIKFVKDNPKTASEKFNEVFSDVGYVANESTILNSNNYYYDNNDMKDVLTKFLEKIYDLNPSLLADKLPDDGFYYISK